MQSGTANTRHVNSCAATDTSQNREGRPPTANPERGGKVAGLRDFLENTPFWRRNRPKPFVYIRVIEAKRAWRRNGCQSKSGGRFRPHQRLAPWQKRRGLSVEMKLRGAEQQKG